MKNTTTIFGNSGYYLISFFLALQILCTQQLYACNRYNDSLELVKLYNATNGPGWINPWDLTQPIDTWEGIKLFETEVEEVNLSSRNLRGYIPRFNALLCVRKIDLSYNSLIGSIPNFNILTDLETLLLDHNHLQGLIPDLIASPSWLRELNLSHNNIIGSVPDFSSFANLELLILSNNFLSNANYILQGQSTIRYIDLSFNQLDSIPHIIFLSESYAYEINLSYNQLKNIPEFSFNSSSGSYIKSFNLSNNFLQDTIPYFSDLASFGTLDLSNNSLEGVVPVFYSQNNGIIKLNGNKLTSTIGIYIDSENFDSLDLRNNQLSFDDLIPQAHTFNYGLRYNPQSHIGRDTFIYLNLTDNYDLSSHIPIDSGLSSNTYIWYHDGIEIDRRQTNDFILTNFSGAKVGHYHCEVTNSQVPGLTLTSAVIAIQFATLPVMNAKHVSGIERILFEQTCFGDADGNGKMDLLAYGEGNSFSSKTLLFKNIDKGEFEAITTFFPPIPQDLNIQELNWIDYDHDRDLDIAYRDETGKMFIYSNEGYNYFYLLPPSALQSQNFMGGPYQQIGDWENDGDMDFLSALSNEVITKDRLDTFSYHIAGNMTSHESTFWYDFDQDGDLDYIQFDQNNLILFPNTDGTFGPGRLIHTFPKTFEREDLIFHDIDLNGSLDFGIIQGNSWQKWVNDGRGYFTLDSQVRLLNENSIVTVSDINSDGFNDLVLIEKTNQTLLNIYLYRASQGYTFTQQFSLGNGIFSNPSWIDFDKDSDLDLYLLMKPNQHSAFKPFLLENISTQHNELPKAPTHLEISVIHDTLIQFSWNPGPDIETPFSALSYNLYLGTRRGATDIVSPMSNMLTGLRYSPQKGNTYINPFYLIEGLSPGFYHWSVQTIDHHNEGGGFAPRDSFLVPDPQERDLADLTLTLEHLRPYTVTLGSKLLIKNTIYNRGLSKSDSCSLRYYLSHDMKLDSSDLLLQSTKVGEMESGKYLPIEDFIYPFSVPRDFQGGEYFIIFSLDDENIIEEYNEENNISRQLLFYDSSKPIIREQKTKTPTHIICNEASGKGRIVFEYTNPMRVGGARLILEGISSPYKDTLDLSKQMSLKGILGTIDTMLSRDIFLPDSQGVRYQLELIDTIFNEVIDYSAWYSTYREYTGNGLEISELVTINDLWTSRNYRRWFFKPESAYNFISPILSDTSIAIKDILNLDAWGRYKKDWRLLRLKKIGGLNQELLFDDYLQNGFNNFVGGKGYFLSMVKKSSKLYTGPIKFPQIKKDSSFAINLKKGWNLLGNPFNFHLNWEDIKKKNLHLGLETAYLYQGYAYTNIHASEMNSIWPRFQGLLLYFDKIEGKLEIPITMNPCIYNPSICKQGTKTYKEITKEDWEVDMLLTSGGYNLQMLTIGMNPEADSGYDSKDYLAPPLMDANQLIAFTQNSNSTWEKFAGDIVPTAKRYTWTYQIKTDVKDGKVTLEWENEYFGNNDYSIILIDEGSQEIIDMRDKTNHIFDLAISDRFQLIYIPKIEKTDIKPTRSILQQPYPNPFDKEINIPYTNAEKNPGQESFIDIIDMRGRIVVTFTNLENQPGFHKIKWDGRTSSGKVAPSGLYFVRLQTKDGKIQNRKIIKN